MLLLEITNMEKFYEFSLLTETEQRLRDPLFFVLSGRQQVEKLLRCVTVEWPLINMHVKCLDSNYTVPSRRLSV